MISTRNYITIIFFLAFFVFSETSSAALLELNAINGGFWVEVHPNNSNDYINYHYPITGETIVIESGDYVYWGWGCNEGYGDWYDDRYLHASVETTPSNIPGGISHEVNGFLMEDNININLVCEENPPQTFNLTVEYSPHVIVTGKKYFVTESISCGDGNNSCSVEVPIRHDLWLEAIPKEGYKIIGFYNLVSKTLYNEQWYCDENLNNCRFVYEYTDDAIINPPKDIALRVIYEEINEPYSITLMMATILASQKNAKNNIRNE